MRSHCGRRGGCCSPLAFELVIKPYLPQSAALPLKHFPKDCLLLSSVPSFALFCCTSDNCCFFTTLKARHDRHLLSMEITELLVNLEHVISRSRSRSVLQAPMFRAGDLSLSGTPRSRVTVTLRTVSLDGGRPLNVPTITAALSLSHSPGRRNVSGLNTGPGMRIPVKPYSNNLPFKDNRGVNVTCFI